MLRTRLAVQLLRLGAEIKGNDRGVDGHEILADLVGAPRENVSRACKVLTDRGLIRYGNKRFILIDFDGLAKFYKM